MTPELRQLLLNSDDAHGDEFPSQPADTLATLEEIEEIRKDIHSRLGFPLESGSIQDASYLQQLYVLTNQQRESRARSGCYKHEYEIDIRFSNFGKLFTIHSDMDPSLASYDVESIIASASAFGWRYAPACELHVPYDGTNASLRSEGITWWRRFFDFL